MVRLDLFRYYFRNRVEGNRKIRPVRHNCKQSIANLWQREKGILGGMATKLVKWLWGGGGQTHYNWDDRSIEVSRSKRSLETSWHIEER